MKQRYFTKPFAFAGDQTPIPDPLQPSGVVSFNQGWGFDYQRDQATDPLAKPIDRMEMNYLMSVMTENIKQYQENGFPEFITPADNGGTPYAYQRGNIVQWSASDNAPFGYFISTVNNNTSDPTNIINWQLIDFFSLLNLVTPPQFDNSTKPATTEFVKRQGVEYAGAVDAPPLTADHAGKIVVVDVADGPKTLNIPAAGVPVGALFNLGANNGNNTLTINAPPGGLFTTGSYVIGTSIGLRSHERVELVNIGGLIYLVMNGAPAYRPEFAASLAGNGYQVLPSGLILQWGKVTIGPSGYADFIFPIAFPAACLGLSAFYQGSLGPTPNEVIFTASPPSNTGGRAIAQRPDGSTISSGVEWPFLAIGC
jgi:hypothetical protein